MPNRFLSGLFHHFPRQPQAEDEELQDRVAYLKQVNSWFAAQEQGLNLEEIDLLESDSEERSKLRRREKRLEFTQRNKPKKKEGKPRPRAKILEEKAVIFNPALDPVPFAVEALVTAPTECDLVQIDFLEQRSLCQRVLKSKTRQVRNEQGPLGIPGDFEIGFGNDFVVDISSGQKEDEPGQVGLLLVEKAPVRSLKKEGRLKKKKKQPAVKSQSRALPPEEKRSAKKFSFQIEESEGSLASEMSPKRSSPPKSSEKQEVRESKKALLKKYLKSKQEVKLSPKGSPTSTKFSLNGKKKTDPFAEQRRLARRKERILSKESEMLSEEWAGRPKKDQIFTTKKVSPKPPQGGLFKAQRSHRMLSSSQFSSTAVVRPKEEDMMKDEDPYAPKSVFDTVKPNPRPKSIMSVMSQTSQQASEDDDLGLIITNDSVRQKRSKKPVSSQKLHLSDKPKPRFAPPHSKIIRSGKPSPMRSSSFSANSEKSIARPQIESSTSLISMAQESEQQSPSEIWSDIFDFSSLERSNRKHESPRPSSSAKKIKKLQRERFPKEFQKTKQSQPQQPQPLAGQSEANFIDLNTPTSSRSASSKRSVQPSPEVCIQQIRDIPLEMAFNEFRKKGEMRQPITDGLQPRHYPPQQSFLVSASEPSSANSLINQRALSQLAQSLAQTQNILNMTTSTLAFQNYFQASDTPKQKLIASSGQSNPAPSPGRKRNQLSNGPPQTSSSASWPEPSDERMTAGPTPAAVQPRNDIEQRPSTSKNTSGDSTALQRSYSANQNVHQIVPPSSKPRKPPFKPTELSPLAPSNFPDKQSSHEDKQARQEHPGAHRQKQNRQNQQYLPRPQHQSQQSQSHQHRSQHSRLQQHQQNPQSHQQQHHQHQQHQHQHRLKQPQPQPQTRPPQQGLLIRKREKKERPRMDSPEVEIIEGIKKRKLLG